MVAALVGSRMTPVFSPRLKSRFGFGSFSFSTTVRGSGVSTLAMLAKTAFSLLVLSGAAFRSKENFTVPEVRGWPF